jgi:hypothetical protein
MILGKVVGKYILQSQCEHVNLTKQIIGIKLLKVHLYLWLIVGHYLQTRFQC